MEESLINNVQPEQELNNGQMPIDTTSIPTIAKPIVGCSASSFEPVSFGIEDWFIKRIGQWNDAEKEGFLKL
jgi:hypothetical protein